MTTSPAVESELELALELMQKHSSVLARFGYKLAETFLETSKLVSDSRVFVFQSDRAGRRIRMAYYTPAPKSARMFVVSIQKHDGQSFMLLDYLTKHRRDDLKARLMPAPPDVEEFWRDYFAALDELFAADANLRAIIEGKAWEDVPFDWEDYK